LETSKKRKMIRRLLVAAVVSLCVVGSGTATAAGKGRASSGTRGCHRTFKCGH